MFIWRKLAKSSYDTWSGFLVQLRREIGFDWRFSWEKLSEVNFSEARPSTCAQSWPCALSIEKVFVYFKLPLHRSGAPAKWTRLCTCAQRCACTASIEHVLVFRSFCLAGPELQWACCDPWECFAQSCMTELNRRRFCSLTSLAARVWKSNRRSD